MVRRCFAVCALALTSALCGCLVGPNFSAPPAPASTTYTMAGDEPAPTAAALGASNAGLWWRVFRSADLDRTIDLALEGSPTLASAQATLAQADAAVAASRSGLFPQLDASTGAQRERVNFSTFGIASFPGLAAAPTFNLYSAGLTASYLVPTAGATRRQVEGAVARAEAQRHQTEAAGLALTGQVATQVATIAAIRAEIGADEAVLADDRHTLDLARAAIQAGGDSAGRRVGAQSQLAADEALLPPLRQDLAAARHSLALLIGKAPADWTPPDFDLGALQTPGQIPIRLPSELVHRRPDILAAEALLHAATADIGVATARLYPSLSLTGSIAQNSLTADKFFNFASTGYSLGLGLTQPIFDGGRLRAERKETIAARKVALATYELTVLRAFGQVADLLQALTHDQQAHDAELGASSAAAADLKLAQAGFSAGGLGLLPLIDAERTYHLAQRRLIQAEAQTDLDIIQLFIATGANWTTSR